MEFDADRCAVFAQILPVFMLITILDVRFLRSHVRGRGKVDLGLLAFFAIVVVAGEGLALYGASMNGLGETASDIVRDATFLSFGLVVGRPVFEVIADERAARRTRQEDPGDTEPGGDPPPAHSR